MCPNTGYLAICVQPLKLYSGGSRISRGGGGHGPRSGERGLPRRLCFVKFVCQNERIGSLRGAAHWVCPPKSANAIQSHKCSTIFQLFMTHIWHVQDLNTFKQVMFTIHQSDLCFLGSRPVGQIRQISYNCLLEKIFGKPQLAHCDWFYVWFAGHKTYLSMLKMEMYHNHPLLKAFILLLTKEAETNKLHRMTPTSKVFPGKNLLNQIWITTVSIARVKICSDMWPNLSKIYQQL